VVVRDFDLRGMFALPFEADAILIIDPNAVLASTITSQALKTISRGHCQIPQPTHPVDLIELSPSDGPQLAWAHPPCCRLVRAIESRLSALVHEGLYHVSYYNE
jgi:hypothetical protein